MRTIQEIFDTQRGLRSQIARALKITPGAVRQWREVPPSRVLNVEALTGIPRHELRPDLYPRDEAAA